MLRQFRTLQGCTVVAPDGDVGTVREFYFEDDGWTVRYLVIAIPGWMRERRILIMPNVLDEVDAQGGTIAIKFTKQQARMSLPLDSEKPAGRQHEKQLHQYDDSDPYQAIKGMAAYTRVLTPDSDSDAGAAAKNQAKMDRHLLSSNELVTNYTLHAQDTDIGVVEDFILDDEKWTVRYLVVRTRVWFSDKQVLLPFEWIERISLESENIFVNLPSSVIQNAPRYNSAALISNAFERRLRGHYQRKGNGRVARTATKAAKRRRLEELNYTCNEVGNFPVISGPKMPCRLTCFSLVRLPRTQSAHQRRRSAAISDRPPSRAPSQSAQ